MSTREINDVVMTQAVNLMAEELGKGTDRLEAMARVRVVFSLDIAQAKDVLTRAETGRTLDQVQGDIANQLKDLDIETYNPD